MVDDTLTLIFDSVREQGLPKHYRTMAGPFADAFEPPPSRRGLEGLLASGSEEPSPSELVGNIRTLWPKVTLVDLRQESHCYLGEHPVSWFGVKNWANKGKSPVEAKADEERRIRELAGSSSVRVARVYAKDPEGRLAEVHLEEVAYIQVQSEESAARALGLDYLRIPVTDHCRPLDAAVDRFIVFVRDLAPDVWLHFHCHAGDGRTTTFLLLYDMLHNAHSLGLEELAVRQHALGGVDLLHATHEGWKEAPSRERRDFIERFYQYARTRDFRAMTWSEYLTGRSAT